jgi:hypothetical protein
MLTNNPAERRLTSQLLRYWQAACHGRLMPEESELNPETLHDLWPKCFLIQTFDINRDHYVFTYLGQEIIDAYQDGKMEEGQSVVISPQAHKLALSYQQVMLTGAPVISEGEFLTTHSNMVRYRQILLPIGKGEEVLAIFGGMSFKAF